MKKREKGKFEEQSPWEDEKIQTPTGKKNGFWLEKGYLPNGNNGGKKKNRSAAAGRFVNLVAKKKEGVPIWGCLHSPWSRIQGHH